MLNSTELKQQVSSTKDVNEIKLEESRMKHYFHDCEKHMGEWKSISELAQKSFEEWNKEV